MSLPHYVAIDRKTENGCEIQMAASGRSGIMLRLQLVTTAEDDHEHAVTAEDGPLHDTAVLCRLVSPWAGSKRGVVSDSNFARVESVEIVSAPKGTPRSQRLWLSG